MIPDLAADPTATRQSPVRGTPQPILPAVPKKSTSYCIVGPGAYYPERTYELRQRQQDIAKLTAPSPQTALIDRNIARYRAEKKAEAEAEKAKIEQARAEAQRLEALLKANREKQAKVKAFRAAEKLVDLALDGLPQDARGRVNARLLAAGRIHDPELAALFAEEERLSKSQTPVEQSGQFDWRSSLLKKRA
jgi:hypothetical protein